MKKSLKVVIFTIGFIVICAGVLFGIYKYNKIDFAVAEGAKKGTVEITGYKGKAVNVIIPEKIKGKEVLYINSNAFSLSDIESVVIPDTVVRIDEKAFQKCQYLKKVTLGKNVEAIRDYAFFECPLLSEVNLPGKLSTIGIAAFSKCDSLKEFTVDEGSPFVNDNGVLYNADKTVAMWAPSDFNFANYKFPSTVKDFAPFFFMDNKTVKTFSIPETMKTVPQSMFAMCSSLEKVNIPEGVTKIDHNVFLGCTSLKSVYIPKSVTKIGDLVFPYKAKDEDDSNKKEISSEELKYFNPDFKLIVEKDSPAYNYAVKNKIPYELAK